MRELGNNFYIGDSEECELNIKFCKLSEKHCKLKLLGESIYYSLEDCESENGTWKRISNLEDYVEIKQDKTEFKFFNYEFCIEKIKASGCP